MALISSYPTHSSEGAVKVFCIGMNKTGTTSLDTFFRNLGFSVGDQATGELLIKDWAVRNFEPIISLANSAQVFQDIPFSLPFTFVALDQAFPRSKYILSVRDSSNQWFDSITRFHTTIIGKDRVPTADDLKRFSYRYQGWLYDAMRLMFDTPEEQPYFRQTLIARYEEHNRTVTDYFRYRPECLLTINLADKTAAQKITTFLGISDAGTSMPHLNRSI